MTAALRTLLEELHSISMDIENAKPTIRTKALLKLNDIFDNRDEELRILFTNSDTESNITWPSLFNSLHTAIGNQTECLKTASNSQSSQSTTLQNKNNDHINVFQKCINIANRDEQIISCTAIIEAATHCFTERLMVQHFGLCYLQIVKKNVLQYVHGNLAVIKEDSWYSLLEHCFKLYVRTNIPKLMILECVSLIIQHGTRHTHLTLRLHEFLPKIIEISKEQLALKAKCELLRIAYEICHNLALSQQISISSFIVEILRPLLKFYDFNLDVDSKTVLFKLFHIALVTHHPDTPQPNGVQPPSNTTGDQLDLWHRHVTDIYSIVDKEIKSLNKQLSRGQTNPTICNIFVQMAARECAIAFWNPAIWETAAWDEHQQKRRRHSTKLEKILELVEFDRGKYCWRWMRILSELLTQYPQLLAAEDYQPMLKVLTEFQETIQYSIQLKSLKKLCAVMLAKENDLMLVSALITDEWCNEHWYRIAQLAFRSSTTNLSTSYENLEILCLLIKHRKFESNSFVEIIIKAVTSNEIKKSDEAVRLLITIFQTVNIDAFTDAKEVRISVINWLHPQSSPHEFVKSVQNSSKLDVNLVSELLALCILSKISYIPQCSISNDISDEFTIFIGNLETNLQYRRLDKLIIDEDANKVVNRIKSIPKITLTDSNQLKAVLVVSYYNELEKVLNPDNRFELTQNRTEDCNQIAISLATFMRILQNLINYEAIDEEKYQKSFLTKRIQIKLDQMNIALDPLINAQQEPKEILDIAERLLTVFNDDISPMLIDIIVGNQKNRSIVNWCHKKLSTARLGDLEEVSTVNASAVISNLHKLTIDRRIEMSLLLILVQLSAHENEDGRLAFEHVEEFDFDVMCQRDLFVLFEVMKAIMRQPSNEKRAEWITDWIKLIIKKYQQNHEICERVIDLMPIFFSYVKPHFRSEWHAVVAILITSFFKQAKMRKYGPNVVIKIVNMAKYLAQEYCDHLDDYKIPFQFLANFLHSNMLSIQIATVDCLSHVFDKQWLISSQPNKGELTVKDFYADLFEALKCDELLVQATDDQDTQARNKAIRIQLYTSIMAKNYLLQKQCLFLLTKFAKEIDLGSDVVLRIVKSSRNSADGTDDYIENLKEDIPYLVSMWIKDSHEIRKFPWYLTGQTSFDDFINSHKDLVTIAVLRYMPEFIQDWLNTVYSEFHQLLTTEIIVNCLAYLAPLTTDSDQIWPSYKRSGLLMTEILLQKMPDIEQYYVTNKMDVVEQMLLNTWDNNQFTEFFDYNLDFVDEGHTINYEQFVHSLEYIQVKHLNGADIIITECTKNPYSIVVSLNMFKTCIQNANFVDKKFVHLFHICCLIEKVSKFLTGNVQTINVNIIKELLTSDIIYFLCNSIANDKFTIALKTAACKYFWRFCRETLPNCSNEFKPHLNYIVSAIFPQIKNNQGTKLEANALKLLHFLIVEQRAQLKDSIALLDNFPAQSVFDDLRIVQEDAKYNGRTFSLFEEIEYFLKIEQRKIEGLTSLKQHLSTKKSELQAIYKPIYELSGFSKDCEKSLIHRLIVSLLETIQGTDMEKSHMAAKCLGELGPSDLRTIVLRSDIKHNTYQWCSNFEEVTSDLCHVALGKLNNLLSHSDVRLVKSVLAASQFLMGTEIVESSNYSEEFPHLAVIKAKNPIIPLRNPTRALKLKQYFEAVEIQTHSSWIKHFVIELFDLFGDQHLKFVASYQIHFAEAMLPLLIKALLTTQQTEYYKELQESIEMFFIGHLNGESTTHNNTTARNTTLPEHMRLTPNTNSDLPIFMNKLSIKSMLNVVECVRSHNFHTAKESSKISLPYADIAIAANYCDAYFTAILYGELSCTKWGKTSSTCDAKLRNIMKDAYISIGEMDAVPAFLDPVQARLQYLRLNQSWNQIFLQHDASALKNTAIDERYTQDLAQSGLFSLANRLTNASDSEKYNCAWRLGDWNLLDANDERTSNRGRLDLDFEKHHYFALKCFQSKDEIGTRSSIKYGREALIKSFKQSSFECTKNLYKNLGALHLLQQIEEFCDIQFPASLTPSNPEFLINKWKYQDVISPSDFHYREPILAQRIAILNAIGVRARRKVENVLKVTEGIQDMLLNLVSESIEDKKFSLATRYLAILNNQQPSLSKENKLRTNIEDAKLCWNMGDQFLAKALVQQVANESIFSLSILRAQRIFGVYLAESRSENTASIIANQLEGSLKTLKTWKTNLNLAAGSSQHLLMETYETFERKHKYQTYKAIAKYADREYQQIADYMKSDNFTKKRSTIQSHQAQVDELNQRTKRKQKLTDDEKKSLALFTKTIQIDKGDVQNTEYDSGVYLKLALTNYIKTILLEETEFNSTPLFRIFSLWFSNKVNANALELIENNFRHIPSYKFVQLLPQIASRLTNDGENFGKIVENIVERCAIDHPYHTIHQVLALANAHKDDPASKTVSISQRVVAAKKLLQKLYKNSELRPILQQTEKMCDVLITLANTPMENVNRSSNSSLMQLKQLDRVHCPSIKLPILIAGDYKKFLTTIVRWSDKISDVGGINAPKKLNVLCSDGKSHPQLLKGKDDLRQDAVMQQVFSIINVLLNGSQRTRKDRLIIRTYVVVPFTQRCGILEWCANTMPLNEYLVTNKNKKGAHERYHPKDMPIAECRKKIAAIPREAPLDLKMKIFRDICNKLQPVLNYFFLEKFPSPGEWFEKRLAYAHSLATTSMIGYILGIGDRHVSNILIDETTAELVHIDFGIAFEQGKCLPTPETIPFRLTRDLVSALGCTGVDGVFRKSCEKTMEVLRENKTTIVTILEVLLHDPLYTWSISNTKAHRDQSADNLARSYDADSNIMAERALMRLEEKLNGKHMSRSEASSVEGHVETLIKEAISDRNLCRLFQGFQAYL